MLIEIWFALQYFEEKIYIFYKNLFLSFIFLWQYCLHKYFVCDVGLRLSSALIPLRLRFWSSSSLTWLYLLIQFNTYDNLLKKWFDEMLPLCLKKVKHRIECNILEFYILILICNILNKQKLFFLSPITVVHYNVFPLKQ